MKIGFIGLGNMGLPMARNLLRSGFSLWVYNRSRSKADQLGLPDDRIAESPAQLTAQVDIVLSCLADEATDEALFCGSGGVFQAARHGQVLVDHSTVAPPTSRRFFELAREKGADFLDAPLSGGPEGAESATLTIMAGGGKRAFDKVLPVLRAMGETIVLMGECGSGSATKLVNQILVGIHTLAACEAMQVALKSGVNADKLLDVLMNSWGASRMLSRNAPRILSGEFGPSAAPIRNLVKDLGIALEIAEEMRLKVPALRCADQVYRGAARQGLALHDLTAIYQVLEESTF